MVRTDVSWVNVSGSYIYPNNATGYDLLIKGTNKYINFNSISGTTWYGFRDNSGTLQFKNSGGDRDTFVGDTELSTTYLKLDQTTPQTITGGIPLLTNLTPSNDYDIATKKYVDDVGADAIKNIETVTAVSDTLDWDNYTVLVDTSSNNVTINLPAAADNTGRIYNIKCIDDTNTCTVDPNWAETIDWEASITVSKRTCITVQSNWTSRFII